MFDRLEADFAKVLAGITPPETVYECKAAFRDGHSAVHHIRERVSGASREAALQEFLTRADEEYDGCTRIDQSARIAPKE